MSLAVLVIVAVVQALFILGLLVLLVAGHWFGARASQRRDQEERLAATTLHAWLSARCSTEAAVAMIDRLRFAAVAARLQRSSLQLGGKDWERIVELVRRTEWFARVRRRADSRFWWRRLHASRLLAILAGPEDLAILGRRIDDARPEIMVAGVLGLRRVRDRELVAKVLQATVSAPAVVQAFMLEVLSECRAELLAVLLERFHRPRDLGELVVMLRLAGRLGVPALLDHVLRGVEHPELEVRIATARALAMYPHPDSSSALLQLLQDPAWEVRAQAAASLGGIGAIETSLPLGRALADPSWWVRLRAAIALRLFGAPGIQILQDVDPVDRFAHEMSNYVLGLDESAMAEYTGIAEMEFGTPASPAGGRAA